MNHSVFDEVWDAREVQVWYWSGVALHRMGEVERICLGTYCLFETGACSIVFIGLP